MNVRDLFAWPEAWPLLLLVPVVGVLFYVLDRRRAGRLLRITGVRAPLLASDLNPGIRTARRRLHDAAILLCFIAMLQPVWGEGFRRIEQRGIDMVVCLDVSRSMLARDMAPSRLAHAQQEIRNMVEQVHGDRLALIAFAGEARLIVPLTQDTASFALLASQAGPLSVERGGTNLGAALEGALDALAGQSGQHEVVVLITDGEDLEQRGLQAARRCKDRNVRVHCVGFGSTRGSKIALERETGETFLRDRSGAEVVSAMDATGLRAMAETTGGEFIEAGARPMPLLELYRNRIVPMTRKAFEGEERRERKNRYQLFLLAAFLLLMVESFLSERKL